jgi:hypothetical protein
MGNSRIRSKDRAENSAPAGLLRRGGQRKDPHEAGLSQGEGCVESGQPGLSIRISLSASIDAHDRPVRRMPFIRDAEFRLAERP